MPDTKTTSGHTKIRHVRIPDNIWIAAAQRAENDGMTISEVTRELLRDYANGHIDIVRR